MPMGRLQLSQVNRTNTLSKTLSVADVSEVLKKSLEENTLMRQRNNKEIVKSKFLRMSRLGIYFNGYSQQII